MHSLSYPPNLVPFTAKTTMNYTDYGGSAPHPQTVTRVTLSLLLRFFWYCGFPKMTIIWLTSVSLLVRDCTALFYPPFLGRLSRWTSSSCSCSCSHLCSSYCPFFSFCSCLLLLLLLMLQLLHLTSSSCTPGRQREDRALQPDWQHLVRTCQGHVRDHHLWIPREARTFNELRRYHTRLVDSIGAPKMYILGNRILGTQILTLGFLTNYKFRSIPGEIFFMFCVFHSGSSSKTP